MADTPFANERSPLLATLRNDVINATLWDDVINATITPVSPGDVSVLGRMALPRVPAAVSFLYLALILVTLVIGIPGNGIVTLAYVRVKSKSTCDWYIFFIAVFDLLSCTFRVTGFLLEYLERWPTYTNSSYCKFMTWLSQTTVCMGNLLFALIALDRFTKICSFRKLSICPRQSRDLCLVMVVVTAFLAAPCLYLFENLPRGVCQVRPTFVQSSWVAAYYSIMFILFLVMMVIVVFCYACIFAKIRGSRRIFNLQQPMADASPDAVYTIEVRSGPCTDRTDNVLDSLSPGSQSMRFKSPVTTNTYISKAIEENSQTSLPMGQDDHSRVSRVAGDRVSVSYDHHDYTSNDWKTRTTRGNKTVTVAQEATRGRRQRRDFKITGLLFLVTIVFILSWIPPYASMVKAFYIGYTFPISQADYILMTYGPSIFMINNFANPLIYVCLSSIFRKKVKELFLGLRCRPR